jgi:leucyl aminopeptidase
MKLFEAAFASEPQDKIIPIYLVEKNSIPKDPWLKVTGFSANPNEMCLVPGDNQTLIAVYVGADPDNMMWSLAGLPKALPAGQYQLHTSYANIKLYIGWALGFYRFGPSKKQEFSKAQLVLPQQIDQQYLKSFIDNCCLVRNLINMPANQLTPIKLVKIAEDLAGDHQACFNKIVGEDLLKQNYPSVYAVGQGSEHPSALIDFTWGEENHPTITLVGKGVTFDTGGLDIKSAAGMRLMKKDMGGAAHALGLASLIMELKLPVRLRVIIPTVENAVSGKAMRPMDIIDTRKGVTVEITHTDAEGRVILADALWEGSSENPDLLIDFATLTGAARVALGPEISAMFSNNDQVANEILMTSQQQQDPMWRLPLWKGYRKWIKGRTADLCNDASASLAGEVTTAGAITAALYLEEFVVPDTPWVHLDIFGCNLSSQPGRPEGGDMVAVWTIFEYLKKKYQS